MSAWPISRILFTLIFFTAGKVRYMTETFVIDNRSLIDGAQFIVCGVGQ
jgi:hypothetical protein